jgi:hypothetical protein
MRIGIGIGLTWTRSGGGSAGPVLATLAVTPTVRYHPYFSTVTTSGGKVTLATDLQGLADATEGAEGVGPVEMTDGNGRKFWRFEGAAYMNVAATLTAAINRNASVFFVGRIHNASSNNDIFSFGNVAGGTAQNTGLSQLAAVRASNGAPFARVHGASGASDAAQKQWMVTGAQPQVIGCSSRTTAAGASSLWVNSKRAAVAQGSIGATSLVGGEIGRYAFSPGASGAWGKFDLYELVIYNTAVSNANGDLISAALMAAHGIVDFENTLIMDGDSITQGTGLVTSGLNAAMIMTEPGAGLIPATWRVVNMGISGNQVSNLVTKRDDGTGWPVAFLSGGENVLAFEIGRNDFVAGGRSAAEHYVNVVAYLNTTTTGVLQRGWTVRQLANIATATGAVQTSTEAYRALIRDAAYLTATETNTGGAFDGKLSIVSTDLIEDGAAGTIFESGADAINTTYYAGDSTHPSILGAQKRVNGGTTPAYAIAAGLT